MDNKKIGERLRALRGEASANETAKAVGVSVSALFMYERGERVPRDETKIKIADYYGKTVEAIFYT